MILRHLNEVVSFAYLMHYHQIYEVIIFGVSPVYLANCAAHIYIYIYIYIVRLTQWCLVNIYNYKPMPSLYRFQQMIAPHDDVIKWKQFPPLCGELIPITKASDEGLGVFFDLCLNMRLSKQSWGWWPETPSSSLWRQYIMWKFPYKCIRSQCLTLTNSKTIYNAVSLQHPII